MSPRITRHITIVVTDDSGCETMYPSTTNVEVVPPGVELEVAVLPPRPLWLRAFGVFKSIRDRRNRHEEGTC